MKSAVVYYSRSGGNWINGDKAELKVGNTERAAAKVAFYSSSSLFRIIPKKNYSTDYDTCCKEAKEDLENKVIPALYSYPSIKDYDVIYLGFPIFWESLPRPVVSFLSHYDFTGKKIYPFCTHEGSSFGTTLSEIRELCKGAEVLDPLPISGSLVEESFPAIEAWVKKHNEE